jgi:DNA repair photolyase
VARDTDLIKKFDDRKVGFTITTLDDDVRKNFEPSSSSVKEKLEAIKQLKENGIKVYVFFGPMLPYLSDNNLDEFFQTMRELKIDEVMIDRLNIKAGVLPKLEKVLVEKYPELASKWKDALSNKAYYENLKKEIEGLCRKNNLECNFCY